MNGDGRWQQERPWWADEVGCLGWVSDDTGLLALVEIGPHARSLTTLSGSFKRGPVTWWRSEPIQKPQTPDPIPGPKKGWLKGHVILNPTGAMTFYFGPTVEDAWNSFMTDHPLPISFYQGEGFRAEAIEFRTAGE